MSEVLYRRIELGDGHVKYDPIPECEVRTATPVCDLCDAELMCAACGHQQRPGAAQASWMPIETAPRDGTVIFVTVWTDMYGWVRGTSHWESFRGISGWISRGISEPPGELGLAHPSHWQPLPTTSMLPSAHRASLWDADCSKYPDCKCDSVCVDIGAAAASADGGPAA